ncbi:type II toxin-antitoxin system PemK/MazF family toxin [Corynebacterium mendelii]|uniref:Type II toxin-antitoxin system PemK/MazF family toxin n=1 Tax=Corynebacterium mendelii TaxID=2765362 RepID=A0A939E1X9_9CORY|nr:hypothetical protein [Corynebacterium mendelii]MBN9644191.1 hypothetical protein [Corynebacterium mendelii]
MRHSNIDDPGWWQRLGASLGLHKEEPLDRGLRLIGERLGLDDEQLPPTTTRGAVDYSAEPTAALARNIFYAPDMDGQADPGEVVWIRVQRPDNPKQSVDRAILVIGRARQTILGLLISPAAEHATEDNWLGIGSGAWDEQGRPCFVRMDITLEVPESSIRRQGTVLPQRRFERVASMLRSVYGWG